MIYFVYSSCGTIGFMLLGSYARKHVSAIASVMALVSMEYDEDGGRGTPGAMREPMIIFVFC